MIKANISGAKEQINRVKGMTDMCKSTWDAETLWDVPCTVSLMVLVPFDASVEAKKQRPRILESRSVEISLRSKPFGSGRLRQAFHMKHDGGKWVAKMFTDSKYNTEEIALGAVWMMLIAQAYAKLFKQKSGVELCYINGLAMLKQRELIMAEPFMEGGKFTSFNNNGGRLNGDPKYEPSNAFSHYTWVESHGDLIVVDVQGFERDGVFTLTDPALHSRDDWGARYFGDTDMGNEGMEKFFQSHKCGKTCKRLGIDKTRLEPAKKLNEFDK